MRQREKYDIKWFTSSFISYKIDSYGVNGVIVAEMI
jgi:hypothetical protein